jgi:hypothetical protein
MIEEFGDALIRNPNDPPTFLILIMMTVAATCTQEAGNWKWKGKIT